MLASITILRANMLPRRSTQTSVVAPPSSVPVNAMRRPSGEKTGSPSFPVTGGRRDRPVPPAPIRPSRAPASKTIRRPPGEYDGERNSLTRHLPPDGTPSVRSHVTMSNRSPRSVRASRPADSNSGPTSPPVFALNAKPIAPFLPGNPA